MGSKKSQEPLCKVWGETIGDSAPVTLPYEMLLVTCGPKAMAPVEE